jgi:catechol 1,2-dioxygenase
MLGQLQVVDENFVPLITQLYSKDDPYLLTDATCAVVDPLVVDFKPRHDDTKATLDLEYDFLIAPKNT